MSEDATEGTMVSILGSVLDIVFDYFNYNTNYMYIVHVHVYT